ncbi:unnamed protein product, partial [Porites lobata]
SLKECRNYQWLNDATRAQGNNRAPFRCDNVLKTKWYRLTGRSGNQMPSSCVPRNRCGTHAPGWISGRHPSAGQISTIKVCFHWYRMVGRSRRDDCCRWQTFIRVRNCGGFFVYEFKKPPACHLRYCGNSAAAPLPPPECRNYQWLNDATRAQGNNRAPFRCDNVLKTKWYRLTGRSGNQMPTSCVPRNRCGTHAPGWLSGRHPSAGQISTVKVCFHWYRMVGRSRRDDCCRWQTFIRVRNCGGFFVYEFKKPPACHLRYCGNSAAAPLPPPECRNYQWLNDATRAQGYNRAPFRCDNVLKTKWYRLTGRSGNQMPTSCVPRNRCGTHAPGWLSGRHPSAGQISTVKVCFHWYRMVGRSRRDDCCRWQTFIRVRNCGGFFVYEFKRPPACHLRYCGK